MDLHSRAYKSAGGIYTTTTFLFFNELQKNIIQWIPALETN